MKRIFGLVMLVVFLFGVFGNVVYAKGSGPGWFHREIRSGCENRFFKNSGPDDSSVWKPGKCPVVIVDPIVPPDPGENPEDYAWLAGECWYQGGMALSVKQDQNWSPFVNVLTFTLNSKSLVFVNTDNVVTTQPLTNVEGLVVQTCEPREFLLEVGSKWQEAPLLTSNGFSLEYNTLTYLSDGHLFKVKNVTGVRSVER